MNEHSFVRSIHSKLPKSIYRWKINDSNQMGVADAFYSGPHGFVFVEYKYLPRLPTRNTTIINFGISPAQQLWLRGRHLDNIDIAVIVGSPQGVVVFEGLGWDKTLNRGEIEMLLNPMSYAVTWIQQQCLGGVHD